MEITGEIKDNRLKLILSSGTDKSREDIPLKDDIYLESGLSEKFVMNGLKPGKNFRVLVFDPSTMSQQEIDVMVEGKEKIRIKGVDKEAYRVRASFKGINFISWIDESGEILKEEESLLGLVRIKESERDAMWFGPATTKDIITETVILPNIDIKNPENITYLKLKFKDVTLQTLNSFKGLSGGRQVLKKDILEIKKEDINKTSNIKIKLILAKRYVAAQKSKTPEMA